MDMERSIMRTALSLGLAAALALSAATPSLARGWHRAAIGAGLGFAAGAVVGAATAPLWGRYGYSDDAYAPGYGYGSDYTYGRAAAYGAYGDRSGLGVVPRYDSDGAAIPLSPFCPYGAALQNRC
jgi:hypothetical protein